MSATVRPQRQEDAEAVRQILVAAFPTAVEADLVDRLNEDRDSEICLVAEEAGRVVGYVMLSRMHVQGDGRRFRALGLGPIAVQPERQRAGLGGRLIREALDRARAVGEELVFVVGEPEYYGRFGFAAATAAPFASPYAGPYLMARALGEMALPASGRADYAPAFSDLD